MNLDKFDKFVLVGCVACFVILLVLHLCLRLLG